jgi:hypothetical protein
MSRPPSGKIPGIAGTGAIGQGDGSYKLGRPVGRPFARGRTGQASAGADSTFSSKLSNSKILDVPDDVSSVPMFPDQDIEYQRYLRTKDLPIPTRKGIPLTISRREIREMVIDEIESSNSIERIDEFGFIARPLAALARSTLGNLADDVIMPVIAPHLARMAAPLTRIFGATVAGRITAPVLARAIMVGKELFGDLPDSIAEGKEAIRQYDSYIAQNPLGPNDAIDDRYYYNVIIPLKDAKFKILENLIDVVERAVNPTGGASMSALRGAFKTAAKGAAATALVDTFDSLRSILSIIGKLIPGDDSIEEGFDTVEELDKRIESIGSFTSPAVMPAGSGIEPTLSELFSIKNTIRSFMISEISKKTNEKEGQQDLDDDLDEISAGGVAGFAAPLHYDKNIANRMKKMHSRYYKIVGTNHFPKP